MKKEVAQFNVKVDPRLGRAIKMYTGVVGIKFQHVVEKLLLMVLTGDMKLENHNESHIRKGDFADFMANIDVYLVMPDELGSYEDEWIDYMLENPMEFTDKWV